MVEGQLIAQIVVVQYVGKGLQEAKLRDVQEVMEEQPISQMMMEQYIMEDQRAHLRDAEELRGEEPAQHEQLQDTSPQGLLGTSLHRKTW